MRRFALVLVFAASALCAAEGPDAASGARPSPFDDLGSHMLWSAFGWPLAFHAAGSGATWWLSTNGTDLEVARFAARQDELVAGVAFTPGMFMGTFFPILVPGWMLFVSKDPEVVGTGAVAAQATAIAFLYDNVLKAVSGRAHPDPGKNTGALSRDFDWGFFRRGVFYGWPSGHSMTNAALAMSVASFHREKPLVVGGCALYAGYVATSMVLGARGGAHWFSDAVAGTLMGASIGWYVGSAFRKAKRGEGPSKVAVLPFVRDDAGGLAVAARI